MAHTKLFLFLLFPVLVFSSPAKQSINQREQFERQKEIFEKLERNQAPNTFRYETEPPALSTEKGVPCFYINTIEDEGITLLSSTEKHHVYNQYIQTCVSLAQLSNLTKQLTALYIKKGYITSQVYLKPQNIAQGNITLFATEGKIATVLPKERYVCSAFWGKEGAMLNIRDLEHAIETINRLPSNHASMRLAPSAEVGYSDIHIDNNTTSRINGTIGINNFGTKHTGEAQGNLTLNLDNPLGINDQFTLNLNSTEHHFKNENALGDGYQYSFPIGRLLTTLSYHKSHYKQFVYGGLNRYTSKGDTKTHTLSLRYNLFHNLSHKVTLGSSVSQYQTKNYISDALIDTASYTLSKASAVVDYAYQASGIYFSTALHYTQGTDWFHAANPTNLNEHYRLYSIDVALLKRFGALQYTLNGHGQHSPHQLFSANQISIGGHYSVRGYQKEGLSGNTGFFARNELSYRSSARWFGALAPDYFIGADYGEIKKEADTNGGKLFGGIVGVKLHKNSLETTLYYAMPLRKRDVAEHETFFGVSLRYGF
jgi:hemolysin activation/secretion protein